MRKTKFICILIVFAIFQTAFGQRGFKVINKAATKIDAKDYRKAIKLLDKAAKMDYGFCGTAYVEAVYNIYLLKFKAYYGLKKYHLARRNLDSITVFGEGCHYLDSLKLLTYQTEYGAEYLKNVIDASISDAYVTCNDDYCFGNIPIIASDKVLRFRIYEDYMDYVFTENQTERNELWKNQFKHSDIYNLIQISE